MSNFVRVSKLSALLLGSVAFSSIALAEVDAGSADEERTEDTIIVTGRYLSNEKFSGTKTLTPIINVPQSLSLVDAEKIAEQGFTNVGDILRYTPGASIGQGEGHRDQITIRGQNTTADFFIDGLRDDVQYFRPLYNLEQVEILRGSNAMIFGRGGGGGIINRVTKRPDVDHSFNTVSVGVDTFGELSAALDSNFAVDETQAVRINAFAESLNNHRDEFEGDRFAINPTYLNKLSDDTRLFLSYEFVTDDRVVDRGVPAEDLDGDGVKTPVEGFEEFFFGSATENKTNLKAHIAKARVDHSFAENISFNATLQYADYDKLYQNLYPSDVDTLANQIELDGYRDTTDRQNLIFQTNLVSEIATGPLQHTLLIGAEYADQQTANARTDNVFAENGDDQLFFEISNPLRIPEQAFSKPARDRESDVQVLSIYAQDQIDIGDHVKLIAGLRFDQFEIDVNDLHNDAQFSRTDEEVSPRVGLIYKPAENISAYVSYSKSFLPESGDQFLTLSASTEELEPEEFENQEIGVKWDIFPDLSLTAAYFQLDRETSLSTADAEDRFKAVTETSGFEIQLNGRLTDWWAVDAGYSNLDSTIVGGSNDGADTGQVPENMLSVWNRFNVSDALGFGLGVIYQDEQFVRSDNVTLVPDFTRVDAAVFYTLENGTSLQLNVENLLDEDYFPDAHSNTNISTGAPLNVRFALRTAF